jgi:hypothetical protein
MTVQPTYHQQDVTQAVFDILVAAAPGLGIAQNADSVYDVFYGDQVNIPRSPAICVEPAPMRRELKTSSAPYPGMMNTFNLLIMVYLYQIGGIGGIQGLDKSKDLLLDQVQDVLHADFRLSGNPGSQDPGLVIFGFCNSIDPGYTMRNGVLMRCGKISWTAQNRSLLLNT